MAQKKKARLGSARPAVNGATHPNGVSSIYAPKPGEGVMAPTALGSGGMKWDGQKLRWDLLPLIVMRLIVAIMTYGAAKYAANNWQAVEPERYWGALFRHLDAARSGEKYDEETGLPHLGHALCCLVFLTWQFLQRSEFQTPDAAERQARSIAKSRVYKNIALSNITQIAIPEEKS